MSFSFTLIKFWHSNDLQNEVICKVTVCLLVAAWLPWSRWNIRNTNQSSWATIRQQYGCVPLRLGIRVPSVLPCWARLETTFQQHSHQLNRGQVPVQACAEIFIVGRAEHARPVSGISFIRRKRVERRPLGWSLRYSARAAGLLHQQQDDSMSSRKYDDIEVLGTLDPHSCLSTSSFALFGHSVSGRVTHADNPTNDHQCNDRFRCFVQTEEEHSMPSRKSY